MQLHQKAKSTNSIKTAVTFETNKALLMSLEIQNALDLFNLVYV